MAVPNFVCVRLGESSAKELTVSSMREETIESSGPSQWSGEKARTVFGGGYLDSGSLLRLNMLHTKRF